MIWTTAFTRFNPRSPRGGATFAFSSGSILPLMFQSTLPTRGSDSPLVCKFIAGWPVSIHAPHEGERHSGRPCRPDPRVVSIHAPHEGERHEDSLEALTATNVSIHAPHEGERHRRSLTHMCAGEVSIHAPHEGERRNIIYLWWGFKPFQSTLPTRGSDSTVQTLLDSFAVVSIHAPHEGERHFLLLLLLARNLFQSTLPTRGSDLRASLQIFHHSVSIHAPHEGERRLSI